MANSRYFEERATFYHAMAMDHASNADSDAYHALATLFDASAARAGAGDPADDADPWLRTLKQPRARSAGPQKREGNRWRTSAPVRAWAPEQTLSSSN
jgi:hypothetical protein